MSLKISRGDRKRNRTIESSFLSGSCVSTMLPMLNFVFPSVAITEFTQNVETAKDRGSCDCFGFENIPNETIGGKWTRITKKYI